MKKTRQLKDEIHRIETEHPGIWDKGSVRRGPFIQKPLELYKISLCTTCMGRASNLKISLPKNIEDNSDYPNIEFVILDYNSADGLGEWIQSEMQEYIKRGILNYYRTEEPKYYSMTHSRNLAFKVAQGDVVNNIDADNFTQPGFVAYVNLLANHQKSKAIFAKGKQMLRGRSGFWKKEFIDLLGGYDEDLKGYGHDDWDLVRRAWGLGFTMMTFGGQFYGNVGSPKHQDANYEEHWKETELANRIKSMNNIINKRFKANKGRHWGQATLKKNFQETIRI
jgi:glycosyltransferase involved in cell wall biosynthesis